MSSRATFSGLLRLEELFPKAKEPGHWLAIVDHGDPGVTEVLRDAGHTYRGMPFTGFVKALDGTEFEHVASCAVDDGAMHVFCIRKRAVFATIDVVRGSVAGVTVQYRSRSHPCLPFKVELRHLRLQGKSGDWVNHIAFDATNGFSTKVRELEEENVEPFWCNLDMAGEPYQATWRTAERLGSLPPMFVEGLASHADRMAEILTSFGTPYMEILKKPSPDELSRLYKGIADSKAAMEDLHRRRLSRLDAIKGEWRDLADLDNLRRVSR